MTKFKATFMSTSVCVVTSDYCYSVAACFNTFLKLNIDDILDIVLSIVAFGYRILPLIYITAPQRFHQCRLWFVSVVYCGPPKVPRSIMIMGRSFFYGDRISYMCRPGLLPSSVPILTCMANGQWDKEPECRGKTVKLLSSNRWCNLSLILVFHGRLLMEQR